MVYPKTASEEIGVALSLNFTPASGPGAFTAARAACDASAACAGLTYGAARGWRGFAGSGPRPGVVAKVRATGPAINAWVGVPSGSE